MSMTGNLFQQGVATRTELAKVRPGSEIEVKDRENAVPTFKGQVLETRAEYGPNSIPALIVLKEDGQQTIVTDTGKWDVTVLFDSSVVRMTKAPENLMGIQQKPALKTGIRFTGGAASAVEIIRWAGGRAVIQYLQGNGAEPDRLVIPTLEGPLTAEVGDVVVRGLKGEFYPIKPDVFEMGYAITPLTPDQAFQVELDQQAVPTVAPLPSMVDIAGMSLQQQMAAQPTPERFPTGTPQPIAPDATAWGAAPGLPGQPGVYERDLNEGGNPLGIPQGGAKP